MQILVNHLTRMQPGWICFAGIELISRRQIRPVQDRPLTRKLLASEGGPLALGHVIELGPSEFCGRVPEIEDRKFHSDQIQLIRQVSFQELHDACAEISASRLRDIFGNELLWINHHPNQPGTAAVDEHAGIRSLGCYWATQGRLQLITSGDRSKVRFEFMEDNLQFSIPVTDIRLFLADHQTPNEVALQQMNSALQNQEKTLVALGLSRAYRISDSQPARHWLQLNNLIA
ncbi:MAG TPA: hypothetical protein PKA83_13925 [Pirellulaceae bacterium]|nr:hypothetical protein [Pirellulaceae bacterium]